MKCFTVDGSGLSKIALVERQSHLTPGAHEVVVDVKAVSLNYRDLLVAEGLYGGKSTSPFIACSDMSGVISAIGSQVKEFKVGDKVLNMPFHFWPAGRIEPHWMNTFVGCMGLDGVLAQKVIYPSYSLTKMPSHLTFPEASTLTIAGLTAWSGIITHGKMRPGQWVLLHGTGGVSIFGAQIAQMIGGRIIMTSSHPDKIEKVKKRLGVEHFFDHKDPHWPEKVQKLTGQGVDLVLDVAGGETLQQSIDACAMGARIATIGVLGGATSTIKIFDLIRKQITIQGIFMESGQELSSFARACEAAKLKPWIDKIFPFQEAPKAFEYLKSQKHIGKVVIEI